MRAGRWGRHLRGERSKLSLPSPQVSLAELRQPSVGNTVSGLLVTQLAQRPSDIFTPRLGAGLKPLRGAASARSDNVSKPEVLYASHSARTRTADLTTMYSRSTFRASRRQL